ncbi:MAG: PIN domain-containing protein [Solirubrobacteraceae bacterium]
MTIVVDTSVVLALLNPRDDFHPRATALYASLDEDLVTTPMAVAEMDYLVRQRAGRSGVDLLWGDLQSGAIQVRWWATAMTETLAIARARPALGLADASLLALAPVVRTTRIATFDHKHFAAACTTDGEPFTLLP